MGFDINHIIKNDVQKVNLLIKNQNGGKNKTFATITAHGPSSRMQEKSIEFYIVPLQQAARDIQDSLSETSTQT